MQQKMIYSRGKNPNSRNGYKKGMKGTMLGKVGNSNPMFGRREEKTNNWKGEDVGYQGVHSWVAKWKGKLSLCEMCGTMTAKKYEWANINHTYKRVLDDYTRLCVKCHLQYDTEKKLRLCPKRNLKQYNI